MTMPIRMQTLRDATLHEAVDKACNAIPPLWPLTSSVAVNPYLGQAGEDLAHAGARLSRVAGAPITMPRHWFLAKIEAGEIKPEDIADAIAASGFGNSLTVEVVRQEAAKDRQLPPALPSIAELATKHTGVDWAGMVSERFGAWASSYFDEGQALWAVDKKQGAWKSWRNFARRDLTPEILSLKGFASRVEQAPEQSFGLIAEAADYLQLAGDALQSYFHALLLSLGGWSQAARYRSWMASLAQTSDGTLVDLLAIRLVWEVALLRQHEAAIGEAWSKTRAVHAEKVVVSPDLAVDVILQEVAERAAQRQLSERFKSARPSSVRCVPKLQAVFCIDVRSETFRRALESLDSGIETLGFAGFFGLATAHREVASDVVERRLPVLLNPGVQSVGETTGGMSADEAMRFKARAGRAWGRFKLAAVSSFAFVESAGFLYAGKLTRDSLGLHPNRPTKDGKPVFVPALDAHAKVDAAERILRAMSMTQDFARLVLVVGHGANVVNNPHESALHCGACGGYSGEVNARLLAGLLNENAVRTALVERGIVIPTATLFVGALHDTTTDAVTLYTEDADISAHANEIEQTRDWLAAAGMLARSERALSLPRARAANDIFHRSRDWAEVRPEWALAGCKAFIAAPRSRTKGLDLEGRAFLHNYAWRSDHGFSVLELIMTAPVVVASWISLQYYGSTVSPALFGGGNKLLHNAVGGIGVLEGNGGALRGGLPWQSVHDGKAYAHEPLRLSVCIEAPQEAIIGILKRHDGVRALFDNRWLHLFALDEQGQMAWRYAGDLKWEPFDKERMVEKAALRAAS